MIEIELRGLEVHGFHGVLARERERGQRFLFDVWLLVPEPRGESIDDAVDYREVAALVREVSESRAFSLLETLASEVAGALLDRFPAQRTRVRVRKPDVELDPPVEYAAATAERSSR